MKESPQNKLIRRARRRAAIRARVQGTAERPRLSVYRSLTQIHGQLIDDASGKTLVAVATGELKGPAGERTGKVAQSYLGGKALAAAAQVKKIKSVVFDRGGFRYQGRVSAFADGARDGGLQF